MLLDRQKGRQHVRQFWLASVVRTTAACTCCISERKDPIIFLQFCLQMCFPQQQPAIFVQRSCKRPPRPPLYRAYFSTMPENKTIENTLLVLCCHNPFHYQYVHHDDLLVVLWFCLVLSMHHPCFFIITATMLFLRRKRFWLQHYFNWHAPQYQRGNSTEFHLPLTAPAARPAWTKHLHLEDHRSEVDCCFRPTSSITSWSVMIFDDIFDTLRCFTMKTV